ncbi:MAG: hypothetical protein JO264_09960 [Acidisphaera sp.]|nr:hypothetical protein [Acidisphaera sp.]
MRRTLLIVLVVGLVIAAIGLLALGAFPPQPHPQPVSKVLPNDRFQTR